MRGRNAAGRWVAFSVWLEEHLPWRLDWIGPWLRSALCHKRGRHEPVDDQCQIAGHRYCWICGAPQPGLNSTPALLELGWSREQIARALVHDHHQWYRAQRDPKGAP